MIILTNCEEGLSRRPWKSPNYFYTDIFLKSLHDAVLYAEIWSGVHTTHAVQSHLLEHKPKPATCTKTLFSLNPSYDRMFVPKVFCF